jgi:hypothetical protein
MSHSNELFRHEKIYKTIFLAFRDHENLALELSETCLPGLPEAKLPKTSKASEVYYGDPLSEGTPSTFEWGEV